MKEIFDQLHIPLFSGELTHSETLEVNDSNFMDLLQNERLEYHLDPNLSYFRTELSAFT